MIAAAEGAARGLGRSRPWLFKSRKALVTREVRVMLYNLSLAIAEDRNLLEPEFIRLPIQDDLSLLDEQSPVIAKKPTPRTKTYTY